MKARLLNSVASCRLDAVRLAGILLTVLSFWGCAATGNFRQVEFTAPAWPDPALRPLLEGVERLGVMCTTDIEPFRELDIEKVMARLSDAITRRLGEMSGVVVVPQDEIVWQIKGGVELDSATVITEVARETLIDSLSLDALILVELEDFQARMTPMTPTPYGLAPDPGLDLAVELRVSLVNLHSGHIWQQSGQQRDWQPIRLQLFGGNQGERQLIAAMSGPLERFLLMVAPPPRTQLRHFELSGN